MLNNIKKFFTEVVVELKKVSWPARTELVGSTTVVIISVLIISFFIWIFDSIFSASIHLIIK